jgi:hypothetical protein
VAVDVIPGHFCSISGSGKASGKYVRHPRREPAEEQEENAATGFNAVGVFGDEVRNDLE